AWLEAAQQREESALARMREAARREDATEKSGATPGLLAPAHEMLGDLLMTRGRAKEALAEYRATLAREPNRYHALDGAMRAAAASGDAKAEASYRTQVKKLTGSRGE